MTDNLPQLVRKSLMIIFTYAPAGLGHLRVTEALYRGLPEQVDPILLRSEEASVGYLHHLTSLNPFTRAVLEWTQSGQPEELFTRIYRRFLRSQTKSLSEHIGELLDERMVDADTVLVVATHFGLAHQIAAVKDELSRSRKVKIVLALQVTDDSPQHIWYVAGADLIVVPSERTKAALLAYGKSSGLPPVRFEVLPYPVSPLLTEPIADDEYKQKLQQLTAGEQSDIQIAIPISGAAVGLTFFRQLVDELHRISPRFHIHIVSKTSPFTQPFLQEMESRPFVTLHTSTTDRDIVDKYEGVYQHELVTMEVTKPSEQAFKALVDPHRRGGALLLFSEPVGRQEYDNLDFLSRHQLIPTPDEQRRMWDSAASGETLSADDSLLTQALHWRGVRLPTDALVAARYIAWCLEQKIFSQMLNCIPEPRPDDPNAHEVSPDGVHQFWEAVSSLLSA